MGVLYTHIAVIGYGVVAGDVLKYVYEKSASLQYTVEYIEHEMHPFNMAKKYAESVGIDYHVITDKNQLLLYLNQLTNQKLLIVSASNNYLFPEELVSNENVSIINFHNALLPEFPGRNAPSWAIYEGKKKTGITWHFVTKGIDTGDIIIQKECMIDDDTKAYELVARQMKLASESFIECFEEILYGNVHAHSQNISRNRKIYKSYEIPSGGVFDLQDSVEKIYRLLRAMDYGKYNIFPMPVTWYKGSKIRIRKYKKISLIDKTDETDRLYLPLDKGHLLMLRYDVLISEKKLGGGIDDIEYLHYLIGELKKVNRRIVSNLIISKDKLCEYIDCGQLRYLFCSEKYLNIWYKERNFARLFFYIADWNAYEPVELDVPVICDLFFSKVSERTGLLVGLLKGVGFEQYSKYHKWIRNTKGITDNDKKEIVCIHKERGNGFFELLKENFDVYSDNIPEDDKVEKFFDDKICYSAYFGNEKKLAGGMVVSSRGRMQIEEFVFSASMQRRKGIASALHSYWYEQNKDMDIQFVAWVRDNNEASIKLHKKYGYIEQDTYKITMKRSSK